MGRDMESNHPVLMQRIPLRKKGRYVLVLVALCTLLPLTVQAQGFQWVRIFQSLLGGNSIQIAVDAAGNVYSSGSFTGTLNFTSPNYVTSYGDYDVYVAKHDAAGNFLWAKRMGNTDVEACNAIALDGAGNVYIMGKFSGTVDFDPNAGTHNLTTAGQVDAFVLKMDPAGNLIWVRQMGGSNTTGQWIVLHDNGRVSVSGFFLPGHPGQHCGL
jgi:hypothetical protein